ncbi:MAG: Triosephosphate isomerase [Candidatus Moranbacteria bacterium GW2011_GWE1_36_7]|nr:MAG: Triosephosphate isomerase [Candidatus Moranbacteria bacterium GW2011_GWD2_36_12]KKQ04816.1 MAG: Triosephosphate isomerase [Candidatus Moranbacteria bacterium GW2011_GWE2_36_40]KKQ13361.1 MAG: Triosephosphate isomerase [Candidatus Moranbacteria bacterium GW2011_GWE1_36_7]
MNLLTIAERDRYFESFKKELKAKKLLDSKIVICPPSVHVESFVKKTKTKTVSIGAQNIFWEERGSYTGEISATMLKDMGVEFVIIGHSERRKYFGETNETANSKIKAVISAGLVAIYCVGETREERDSGFAAQIIVQQIVEGLADISSAKVASVVIAYEPVWSVGSDSIPTSDEILETRILLRKIFAEKYGLQLADKIKVLYGGSVKVTTAKQLCIDPGMDGVLVGRESLIPMELVKIAEIISVSSEQGAVNNK